jgi:membrane protease YdiL (CAAX protease family)
MPAPQTHGRTIAIVLLFEGGLGAVALVIAWLIGHSPFSTDHSPNAMLVLAALGSLAALPLLVFVFALEKLPWPPLRRLDARVREMVQQLFAGASVVELFAISLAAGLGEELLFRGLIQAGMTNWLGGASGMWIALALVSALFGVCHWLDSTYAILATIAGAYFGLLLIATDTLWAPIAAHATYDFLALLYLMKPNDLVRWSV